MSPEQTRESEVPFFVVLACSWQRVKRRLKASGARARAEGLGLPRSLSDARVCRFPLQHPKTDKETSLENMLSSVLRRSAGIKALNQGRSLLSLLPCF